MSTDDFVGKTCPFCQSNLKLGADVIKCSRCGIPHHRECWQSNGGCTTYGCSGQISPSAQEPGMPPGRGDVHFRREGTAKLGNGVVIFCVIFFILYFLMHLCLS